MRRQQRAGPGSVYVGCIVALIGAFFIGIGTLALWQASSMPGQSEAWRESLRSGGFGSMGTGMFFVPMGFYIVHSSLKAVTARPLTARLTESKYCPYCGTEIEKDAVFCFKCGKKTPET